MPNKTPIEWSDYSSNPIYVTTKESGKRGWHCDKPTAGCGHCYSETLNKRFGTGLDYLARNADQLDFHLNEKELLEIIKLNNRLAKKNQTAKLFLCDMTDLFLEQHSDEMLDKIFAVIAWCDNINFQILTKRPGRMEDYIAELWAGRSYEVAEILGSLFPDYQYDPYDCVMESLANQIPNCQFGVSVENRREKFRIDILREIPVEKRFISFEPLLEDLGPLNLTGIHWAIFGGESGPGARPCNLHWIREGIQYCRQFGVAPFVKQLGSLPIISEDAWRNAPTTRILNHLNHKKCPVNFVPILMSDKKGGKIEEFPDDLQIREFLIAEFAASNEEAKSAP